MSVDVIKQHIKTGKFSGLYVLYGEENYLKSYYCSQLIENIVDKGLESFNLQIFDSGHFNSSQIAAAVGNMPMMSERKCVVIRDILPDALKAAEWKELESIIKAAPPECVILYHLNSVTPDRKAPRWKSFLAYAQKNGVAAEIGRLTARELTKWLIKRVKHNGCEIAENDVSYLIELCGEDMNTLIGETDKICALSLQKGGKITRGEIEALAVKPVDSSIYDLARSITNGRLKEALQILDDLFYSREEPVVILSALSGAICDLYRAKTAAEAGIQQAGIESDFSYRGKEFRVRNALRDCGRLESAVLYRQLQLLIKADEKIKSTRADNRVILEQLIIEMSRAGKEQNLDSYQ